MRITVLITIKNNIYIYISNNYNFVKKTRAVNKRTNLGKIYFENIYIITISKVKANVT